MSPDKQHAANRLWDLRKLIQQTPNRAPELARAKDLRPLPRWQSETGAAIMRSPIVKDWGE